MNAILQNPSPRIEFEDTSPSANTPATIYVDGGIICKSEGVLESFAVWFAVFYVFNIRFSKHDRHTLVFIQKGLLKLKDSSKMPSRVFQLIKNIENKIVQANS
jgi:hypothetical protein